MSVMPNFRKRGGGEMSTLKSAHNWYILDVVCVKDEENNWSYDHWVRLGDIPQDLLPESVEEYLHVLMEYGLISDIPAGLEQFEIVQDQNTEHGNIELREGGKPIFAIAHEWVQ